MLKKIQTTMTTGVFVEFKDFTGESAEDIQVQLDAYIALHPEYVYSDITPELPPSFPFGRLRGSK
jgi:hypothetical protein